MKVTRTDAQVENADLVVPVEMVVIASLHGIAVACILADAGETIPAIVFLFLSLTFVLLGGGSRPDRARRARRT